MDRNKIRVGVLHSLTGTMANDEKHLVAVMQMAIDEINCAGGVLGCQVEMLIKDCDRIRTNLLPRQKSSLEKKKFQRFLAAGLLLQEKPLSLLLNNTTRFYGILFNTKVWSKVQTLFTPVVASTSKLNPQFNGRCQKAREDVSS